jgi:DNA-binding NarL/FixJ family response regulator
MRRRDSWDAVAELRSRIPLSFHFTSVELAVLRLVADEMDDETIAAHLRLPRDEVSTAVSAIAARLGASGRADLQRRARETVRSSFPQD